MGTTDGQYMMVYQLLIDNGYWSLVGTNGIQRWFILPGLMVEIRESSVRRSRVKIPSKSARFGSADQFSSAHSRRKVFPNHKKVIKRGVYHGFSMAFLRLGGNR